MSTNYCLGCAASRDTNTSHYTMTTFKYFLQFLGLSNKVSTLHHLRWLNEPYKCQNTFQHKSSKVCMNLCLKLVPLSFCLLQQERKMAADVIELQAFISTNGRVQNKTEVLLWHFKGYFLISSCTSLCLQ